VRIEIKKDIEETYKDEFLKGFTLKEVITFTVALSVAGLIVYILYTKLNLPIETGVYIGVPTMLPILGLGLIKIQGLSLAEYIREIIFSHRIRVLSYDADEIPKNNKMVSMSYKIKKSKKTKRKNTKKENNKTKREESMR